MGPPWRIDRRGGGREEGQYYVTEDHQLTLWGVGWGWGEWGAGLWAPSYFLHLPVLYNDHIANTFDICQFKIQYGDSVIGNVKGYADQSYLFYLCLSLIIRTYYVFLKLCCRSIPETAHQCY